MYEIVRGGYGVNPHWYFRLWQPWKRCRISRSKNEDMELVALFTRRDPASLSPLTEGVPVYSASDLAQHTEDVDVLVLCGGSATDLPQQTPEAAKLFNVVDSFDTHANIPSHFAAVDAAAKEVARSVLFRLVGIRVCSR